MLAEILCIVVVVVVDNVEETCQLGMETDLIGSGRLTRPFFLPFHFQGISTDGM